VQADLRDHAEGVRALRTFDADAVVHLAVDSLVGESMTNPAKYYANNVVAGLTR
jgi:UDP-glucose 4-epimerase